MPGEWWLFERYGRSVPSSRPGGAALPGALARVEATIEQLGLLALRAPKPVPPAEPPQQRPEEEKPALLLGNAALPRSAADVEAAELGVDATGRPATSAGRGRRIGGEETPSERRARLGRIGRDLESGGVDPDADADGNVDPAVLAARRRRAIEDEAFDDRPLVHVNRVTRVAGAMQMQNERAVYGMTNIHLVVEAPPASDDSLALVPEDDGFFVSRRPDISLWNLDKVTARLTREDRTQSLFFEEGVAAGPARALSGRHERRLALEPYPVLEAAMRSANPELYSATSGDESAAALSTRVVAPAPYTGKDRWFQFCVELRSVQFTEHALFTKEDKLARELEEMCAEYRRREAIDLVAYYEGRAHALRTQLARQKAELMAYERAHPFPSDQNTSSSSVDEHLLRLQGGALDTLLQLSECIGQRDREEAEQRSLFVSLYNKWMDVRLARADVTREMKARGLWQADLQPADKTVREAAADKALAAQAQQPQQQQQQPFGSPVVQPSPPLQSFGGAGAQPLYPTGQPSSSPTGAPLGSPSASPVGGASAPYGAAMSSAPQSALSTAQFAAAPQQQQQQQQQQYQQQQPQVYGNPVSPLSPSMGQASPLVDTLSSPSAAQTAANQLAQERFAAATSAQPVAPAASPVDEAHAHYSYSNIDATFSPSATAELASPSGGPLPPPPPPPPPPEMPAPPPQQQQQSLQPQQGYDPTAFQQQQQYQQPQAQSRPDLVHLTPAEVSAQLEYEAQLASYHAALAAQQQPAGQLATYQAALAPQQPLQGIGVMKPTGSTADGQHQEESKEQPPQQQQQQAMHLQAPVSLLQSSPVASPTGPLTRKGQHFTTQDVLLQTQQARAEREAAEQAAAYPQQQQQQQRPALSVDTSGGGSGGPLTGGGGPQTGALTTRRARTELGLDKRPGLLKDVYAGYPAVLKVGKKECRFREPERYPADAAQYARDKRAWDAELDAEVAEYNLRERLQWSLAHGGRPMPPRDRAEQESMDQQLRASIERRKASMRRRPGGPIYKPTFHGDDSGGGSAPWFKDAARCLPEEQRRRHDIEEYKVYARLFVNGQKVSDTMPSSLSFPRFRATFDAKFPLALVARPSSITVQLFHARGAFASDELLGEVGLPVPDFGSPPAHINASFAGGHIDNATAAWKHQPTLADPFGPSRYTSGVLDAVTYWAVDEETLAALGRERDAGPDALVAPELMALSQPDLGRAGIRAKMAHMTTAAANRAAAVSQRGGGASSVAGAGVGGSAGAALKLDPNDPRNAELMELMRRQKLEMAKGGGGALLSAAAVGSHGAGGIGGQLRPVFRVAEFQSDALLVTDKYFQPSARRKVLAARNASGALRDPVPLRDEDIPAPLYAFIEVEEASEERRKAAYARGGTSSAAELEELHAQAQWREKAKILAITHEVYSVAEVVNEQPLPDLAVDWRVLDRLFEPRRALRPKKEASKAVAAPKSCNIVIQIVKGENLPVRRDMLASAASVASARRGPTDVLGNRSGNVSALSLEAQSNVRTFVEIRLQDNSRRTAIGLGANPRWDQIVSLPFHPPAGSFAPSYLSSVDDEIEFNVFDEVADSSDVPGSASTGAGGHTGGLTRTRMTRTSARWLGSFSLPFTTIYAHGRVDGAFQLKVPPLHLGYEQAHPERHAYLYLYATMDPLLTPPPPAPEHFQHINPFYARALAWVEELKAISPSFARRAYTSIVGDIHGMPQFVCRYCAPERPPERYQRPAVFTRFVSIIPFLEDAQVSQGQVRDIWCSSKEFITLAGGDWEEHAILLHNYFTWYDQNLGDTSSGVRWQNFVALGSGFPEGDTAYVLRLAVSVTGTLTAKLLYNAVTGHCYDLMDARSRDTCPLQSLALLFNADNVWANIQQDDDPTRTSFELGNPKCYRAFFTSKADGSGGFTREQAAQMYALSFATLQKSIHYTEEPLSYYVDRASRLERLVERRFEKWRAGTPTRWDYGVAGVLRDLLLAFETHAQGDDQTGGGGGGVGGAGAVPGSALALAAERPLAQLQGAYASVQGFPLHFSDAGDSRLLSAAEDNAVLQAVRHTRIHECDERNAVFALAVYIHPYPNRIGSVWLYIACLIDK